MSFLIAIVLPAIYAVLALLVAGLDWKHAFTAGGSYRSAWIRTLAMGFPFILLGINRGMVQLADLEVDRLCALDGGVHVYETVTLGPENFGSDGTVFPEFRHLMAQKKDINLRYGPDYSVRSMTETLRDGRGLLGPRVTRSVGRFVRVDDGTLLAEWVDYTRFGGDPPGPWEASSHSCPASMFQPPIDRVIFINSGRNR